MHLLAERLVFGGVDRGFPKEVVKTYLMEPMLPFNSSTFMVSSHL
jgi:hypothetical protein